MTYPHAQPVSAPPCCDPEAPDVGFDGYHCGSAARDKRGFDGWVTKHSGRPVPASIRLSFLLLMPAAIWLCLLVGSGAAQPSRSAPQTSPYGGNQASFEHGDNGRSSHFRSDAGLQSWRSGSPLGRREATERFPGAYNLVLDEDGDLYILEGVAPAPGVERPRITKVSSQTLQVEWRTDIDPARRDWTYPGAVAIHANGSVYAVTGRTAIRLDPGTGKVLARRELPGGPAPDDAAYNGFLIMPDGNLLAKSFYRRPGCRSDGFDAFLACGSPVELGSQLVVLNPETLEVVWEGPAPERIGGRISAVQRDGRDLIYLPGQDRIFRLVYVEGALSSDPTWEPPRYREESERPGTAVVAFGDWVLIQANARFSAAPFRISAFHQDIPNLSHRIRPFEGRSPTASFIPSKPTVDVTNSRVFVVDGFGGSAGLVFDPVQGFSVAWLAPERSFNFTTLLGLNAPVLVSTAVEVEGARMESMRYSHERIIARDAATGQALSISTPLPAGPGLNLIPGLDGVIFFLSNDGTLTEIRP